MPIAWGSNERLEARGSVPTARHKPGGCKLAQIIACPVHVSPGFVIWLESALLSSWFTVYLGSSAWRVLLSHWLRARFCHLGLQCFVGVFYVQSVFFLSFGLIARFCHLGLQCIWGLFSVESAFVSLVKSALLSSWVRVYYGVFYVQSVLLSRWLSTRFCHLGLECIWGSFVERMFCRTAWDYAFVIFVHNVFWLFC